MSFQEIISNQKEFVRSGKSREYKTRIQLLLKLKKIIQNNEKKILSALLSDLKKNEYEAYASEVGFIYEEIDFSLKNLKSWMKTKSVCGSLKLFPSRSKIIKEALGSVLIIAPWNYPFQLVFSPLIAAISAGNSCILKPSELAIETQKICLELINENFLPEQLYCVGGGVEQSSELLKENFDFIFFTGSSHVGKIVMKAAAENLTPVCLELGGKSPCIVDDNINLKTTVKRIVWGKFYNAGQTCVAPDYIYIKSSLKKEFLELVKETTLEFFTEDPMDSDDFNKMINIKNLQRAVKLISKDKVYFGGQWDESQLYLAPTILDNITWDDKVMSEEIFAPIMPVMTYSDINEVIAEVAKRPKPLALYLFSKSKAIQDLVLNGISYGGGSINDVVLHLTNPRLPFGGVGSSGTGSYHGKHGFELFSHSKSILIKPFWLDLDLRYPPYSAQKLKWLKKLF